MQTTYTERQVGNMRVMARALGMLAPDSFWTAPIAELAQVANGCGPDSWPEWLRDKAGDIAEFPITTLIHDWDFYKSNGHKKDWALSNWRYDVNAGMEIDSRWPPKWSWERFMKRRQMQAVRRAAVTVLELGSFEAWKECANRA